VHSSKSSTSAIVAIAGASAFTLALFAVLLISLTGRVSEGQSTEQKSSLLALNEEGAEDDDEEGEEEEDDDDDEEDEEEGEEEGEEEDDDDEEEDDDDDQDDEPQKQLETNEDDIGPYPKLSTADSGLGLSCDNENENGRRVAYRDVTGKTQVTVSVAGWAKEPMERRRANRERLERSDDLLSQWESQVTSRPVPARALKGDEQNV